VKKFLPLPPFLPDQSLISGTMQVAENVYPAADGYRPIGALISAADALDEDFQGGTAVIATDGTSYLVAGTATDLYRLAAGEWTSLVTGLTAGRWHFAQFGDYLLAVNGTATRVVDLNAGTDSALAGAPTGTSIAVVGDFVVIGQADGDLLKVQWSAFNDHTGWTPGVDQSGFQPMLTGGEVMGIGGGEYGVILQRQRMVRMERTGDGTDAFSFVEITPNVGCASKGSVAQAGRSVFFLSDRGFMALEDGSGVRPIGNEKVDRSFQAEVSRDDYERLFSAVDPQNTLVWWVVPGQPGKAWIYNWVLDRWSTAKTGMQGIFPGFTPSLSLEEVGALYADLDHIPYSLDDPRFTGGAPRLFIVDNDRVLGTFTGEPMAARLKVGFSELFAANRSRMQDITPVGDMISGVTLTLDARARLGDDASTTSSGTIRPSGRVPIRCSGRYISETWDIAAGTPWSYFQGRYPTFAPGGER
jgi:hypothetical protein